MQTTSSTTPQWLFHRVLWVELTKVLSFFPSHPSIKVLDSNFCFWYSQRKCALGWWCHRIFHLMVSGCCISVNPQTLGSLVSSGLPWSFIHSQLCKVIYPWYTPRLYDGRLAWILSSKHSLLVLKGETLGTLSSIQLMLKITTPKLQVFNQILNRNK